MPSLPLSTETRRALRLWLADCDASFRAFRAVAERREVERLGAELLRTRSRSRARYALHALIDGRADFAAELRRPPVLLWRALQPDMRLHAAPRSERDHQFYVGVIGLSVGQVWPEPARKHVVAALWGLSASHHAIGRLFERAPGVDARAALLAAHRAVIAGCRSHAVAERTKLLIPAGAVGVFIGRLVRSTFLGQPTGLLVLAETFVTRDMLWREQEDRLLPAATDHDDALAVLPINWTLAKGP